MELVIMAAGMGSRFGGLKQIEPIDSDGNFIIDYSIFDAIRSGFTKVTFIIKEENFALFRDTVGKRIENKIETNYVFQNNDNVPEEFVIPETRKKPLGTGHAVLCTKGTIHSNFAVINADDFYGADAFAGLGKFLKELSAKNKYCMVGYEAINTMADTGAVKRGICEIQNGMLKTITESSIEKTSTGLVATPIDGGSKTPFKIAGDQIVSMNMFGFSVGFLEQLDSAFITFLNENKTNLDTAEFFLPSVVSALIKEDRVSTEVLPTSAKWFGITYKEDLAGLKTAIAQMKDAEIYPAHLWK